MISIKGLGAALALFCVSVCADASPSPVSSGICNLNGRTISMPDYYEQLSIVDGSVSIDSSAGSTFGISLTESVSNITLPATEIGMRAELNILFAQGSVGGKTVNFPKSVRLPKGTSYLVELQANRLTSIRLVSVDGGASWLSEKIASYDCTQAPVFQLPALSGENATFNDEGDSVDGWSPLNGTVSASNSVLRYTKSGLGVSWLRKAAPRPAANSDSMTYIRLKATSSPTAVSVLHFYDPATSRQAGIWIGSAQGNTTPSQGSISLTGTPSNPSVRNSVLLATGVDYQNTWLDIGLQFDPIYGTLNCFFREADGRWKFKGRVLSDYVGGTDIYAQFTPDTPAGAVMEIDYITVAHPNLMAFGDSVAAGAPGFDPNPSLGRTNDESTWMRYVTNYKNHRNNLIVNKGIGGNTSYQSLLRMPQTNASGAKVVFLQGPTNDWAAGFSQEASKANMQAIVNSAVAAGSSVVVLNQIYCPQTTYGNTPLPVRRDWAIASWGNLLTMTGVAAFVDVMYALKDDNGFMDPALSAPDGHNNVAGYKVMGELISQ